MTEAVTPRPRRRSRTDLLLEQIAADRDLLSLRVWRRDVVDAIARARENEAGHQREDAAWRRGAGPQAWSRAMDHETSAARSRGRVERLRRVLDALDAQIVRVEAGE